MLAFAEDQLRQPVWMEKRMDLLPESTGQGRTKQIEIGEAKLPQIDGPEMSDQELIEAASEAGLAIIDKKKIRGFAKIGKYLRQAGLIEVKRGRLAGRGEALERTRKVMLELVEDRVIAFAQDDKPVVHHQVVLAAASALVAIVEAENHCDELDLQLEKKMSVQVQQVGQPANQAPPASMPFVAIQEFNQHNHSVAPANVEVVGSPT